MKRNLKITIITIAYFILGLILSFLSSNLLSKLDCDIFFLKGEWFEGDTITLYSSILTGLITILGVLLTIKHEKDESKKDDIIKYKPILEYYGLNKSLNCLCVEVGLEHCLGFIDGLNYDELEKKFLERQTNSKPNYRLLLKNVGRGETSNATIDSFQVSNLNWTDISYLHSNISNPQYIGEIIRGGYLAVDVRFPDYLILPEKPEENIWFELDAKLSINYSDVFNEIRYQYNLILKNRIIVENMENASLVISNCSYHYAKVKYELSEIIPEKLIYSRE